MLFVFGFLVYWKIAKLKFLSLNVSKRFAMMFTNLVPQDDDDRDLIFDGEKIQFCCIEKFPGLNNDSNLT